MSEQRTITVAAYTAAFRAWVTVAGNGFSPPREISPHARGVVEEAMQWLETKFRREHRNGKPVPIEELCTALSTWRKTRHELEELPLVHKSCLLSRMIYAGEPLRTRACPVHGGQWSGWGDLCPAGCSFGPNITGWLPNDLVDPGWPPMPHAGDPQIAALEAALAVEADRDTLLVYADRLQALGDPRGELIALGLAGGSHEDYHRRTEAWLGSLARPPIGELRPAKSMHGRIAMVRGFLHVTLASAADVRTLFDHPLGVYLHTAHVLVRADVDAPGIVRFLATRPHRWLAELSVAARARDEVALLQARAPNLAKIELR